MPLSSRAFIAVALGAAVTAPLAGQQRRILSDNDPQAQLMGYYSAVMQFTPVGMPDRRGRLELGAAATFIPSLSLEDRTVGFGGTKPEGSNLCPVYPRLAASKGFGPVSAELGWTPPVTVCGVKANVLSAALGYRFALAPTWDGHLRVSGVMGTLDAAITCGADAVADPLNLTCYFGSPSADRIAPAALTVDVAAAYQGWRRHRIEPYVSVGVRYERIDFDVNYTRTSAQAGNALTAPVPVAVPALDDHERFRTTLARLQLAAGAVWGVSGRMRLGGEVYYAPGAVLTVRGRASIVIGGGR